MLRESNRQACCLALISFLTVVSGGCENSNRLAAESGKLVGTWAIVSAELAGTSLPSLRGSELTFQKDGTKILKLTSGATERGTYNVIAGQPLGMDTTTDGKSERPKGIYKVSGDRLTLVFAQNGGTRPTKFVSTEASDHLLLDLRRLPAASQPARTNSPAMAVGDLAKPETRCFQMGITGFPHDNTVEAALATQKFAHQYADMICHHIEGVPWEAMHAGKELPSPFVESMNGKKSMTPPGGKVYLAISPGRGKLKGHEKAPNIPRGLRGRLYNDDLVKEAYLRYCRKMIEFFDPDYLAIGIEVNEMYGVIFKREWRTYLDLHKYVYRELKRDHPDLPIFASLTLHNLYNKQGGMVTAMSDLMPYCDMVGVSYYPFFVDESKRLVALDWLMKNFRNYKKPFAMVETNDAAETTKFDSYTVKGTEQKQLQYYRRLFQLAEENDFEFVIAFIHRDYDPLWDKIKGSSPELFKAWMNCGFLDEEGNPRPSFQLWKNYLAADLVAD